MATKMRLQRFGKKGQAYFHIVIADGRAPRDGRFIEKIGIYNPITRPADIQLDFDRALYWVKTGAEPTETVEAILRYTGVAYMHHLLKGVAKGAMTEEQAQAKFEEWKTVKTGKIESAKNDIGLKAKTEDKKRLEAEVKVNQAKADALAKKLAAEAKKAAGVTAEEVEEEVAEVVEETPEVVAEASPEVVAEVAPEVVAEVAPEATEEAAPEAPAKEEKE
ncbi:MAG: 30S ribosomal protein S16 [Lentimicrobiaceae bacterium]|jgi:small subunit ribosomal protein S16